MTHFEKHIKKATTDVRLSDAEKARMKTVLQSYMRFHPAPEPVTTYTVTRDWFIFLQRPVAASLVLVLVVGSGVSYAAEGALPGDTLYTMKTHVNEPLKIALASGAEAKAEVEIELAERRIQEATALAADDRLDDATEAKLAVALDAHAESAAVLVEEIDEDDAGAAAEISARFETRLRAREDVLAEVREERAELETSVERAIRTASSRASLLRERAEVRLALAPALGGNPEEAPVAIAATMAMKAAPIALTAESADPAAASLEMSADTVASVAVEEPSQPVVERGTAERMERAAENKLKEMKKKARNSEKAREELKRAEDLIEEGEEHLDDENYAAAFFSFRASLEHSERTSVFLDSAGVLKKVRSKNTRAEEARNNERRNDESDREQSSSAESETERREDEQHESEREEENEDRKQEDERSSEDSKTELNLLQKLDLSL